MLHVTSGMSILLVIWTVNEKDPIWVVTMFRRIYHCRGGKVDRLGDYYIYLYTAIYIQHVVLSAVSFICTRIYMC